MMRHSLGSYASYDNFRMATRGVVRQAPGLATAGRYFRGHSAIYDITATRRAASRAPVPPVGPALLRIGSAAQLAALWPEKICPAITECVPSRIVC
jgi:hypothetical protein